MCRNFLQTYLEAQTNQATNQLGTVEWTLVSHLSPEITFSHLQVATSSHGKFEWPLQSHLQCDRYLDSRFGEHFHPKKESLSHFTPPLVSLIAWLLVVSGESCEWDIMLATYEISLRVNNIVPMRAIQQAAFRTLLQILAVGGRWDVFHPKFITRMEGLKLFGTLVGRSSSWSPSKRLLSEGATSRERTFHHFYVHACSFNCVARPFPSKHCWRGTACERT